MQGSYNDPERTRETLIDGWPHTGDMARMDEENSVYIVDRRKFMIISGGYNVYPCPAKKSPHLVRDTGTR